MESERSFLTFCSYCHGGLDIREPGIVQRVIAWKVPETGEAECLAWLPIPMNEWAHDACVRERTLRRAEDMEIRRMA